MAGDFNCGEVKWETLEAGDDNTWGWRPMKVTMNMMIQWVKEKTRGGEDERYKLDLVFTKSVDLKKYISYMCPFSKCDNFLMEMEVEANTDQEQKENARKIRGITERQNLRS